MNKKEFIKQMSEYTGYDEAKCILINDIIEKYFIFEKKNKEKITQELQDKASLSKDDAKNVYDIAIKIITGEIENKLKHPFKSKD